MSDADEIAGYLNLGHLYAAPDVKMYELTKWQTEVLNAIQAGQRIFLKGATEAYYLKVAE